MGSRDFYVLGIGGNHHNGSACLVRGNRIVVAIQEERLTGIKRARLDCRAHSLAIQYCLSHAGITPKDLDLVVVCPTGWSREESANVVRSPQIETLSNRTSVLTISHHLGHAYGAFMASGFDEAAVLVADGMGSPYCDLALDERRSVKSGITNGSETTSIFLGSRAGIRPIEKHMAENGRWRAFPSSDPVAYQPDPIKPSLLPANGKRGMVEFVSLGQMYQSVAAQLFGKNADGPGNLMALAALGVPILPVEDFFEFCDGRFEFKDTVPKRFLHHDRYPARLEEYHNLAASTQLAFEEGLIKLAKHALRKTDSSNLVVSGGCALNAVANRRLRLEAGCHSAFIPPAPDDCGVSIGAALWGASQLDEIGRLPDRTQKSFGASYDADDILTAAGRLPNVTLISTSNEIAECVDLLMSGKVVGLFAGGSELGPRALGHRSILCDPRRPESKNYLNEKIKFRERFRPFAPVVLEECCDTWFEMDGFTDRSRFMEMAVFARFNVKKRIQGALHVDDSARIQTIAYDEESIISQILRSFFERTGVPLLINTSFNLKGEPIVETPEDALRCMLFSDLDACLIEGTLFVPQSRNWDPLSMTLRLGGDLSRRGNLIAFTRQTRWGPDERSFRCDSERAQVLQYLSTGKTGGELAEFILSIMPWYRGFEPKHVLAIECRQGWISPYSPFEQGDTSTRIQ